MLHFIHPPPLALYIHIPWCVRKCPYCDFNSHALRGALPERDYLRALGADLDHDLVLAEGRRIESIFIGGGTPSLLSADAVAELLAAVRARLPLSADAEITLEANPGTVEIQKFRDFRAAGVNRLSIGVQSFNEPHLQRLGRIHGRDQALRAAEAAHQAGFANFNLDLMYGLPDQSIAQALADIDQAIALQPSHLSHYQLTLEPNTLFHRQPPALPDDDASWAMQTRCQERLAASGYAQYETSAYARPGSQCRHNLNYWRFGDYLGIGAGAHAKLSDTRAGTIRRSWKLKNPRAYLRHAGSAAALGGDDRVPEHDIGFEFMLNALRLTGGFASALYSERSGLPLASIVTPLQSAAERELLSVGDDWIAPTELGRRFLNDLVQIFMP